MRRPDPEAGCALVTFILAVGAAVTIAVVKSIVWLRLAFGGLL